MEFHVRLLFDRDDHRIVAHEAGIAALGAGRKANFSDLIQSHRLAIHGGHDKVSKVSQALGAPDVADQELASVLVGKAAARVRAKASQCCSTSS